MSIRCFSAAAFASCVVAAAGCDRSGTAVGTAAKTTKPGVTVPYAVSEPETAPVRAGLARARWLLVDDGANLLSSSIRKPGVAVLAYFVADDTPIIYNALHNLTFGRRIPYGEAVPVDIDEVRALGFEDPATSVVLFGPAGPCRAQLGAPMVGRASRSDRTLEISYALTGCDMVAKRWAPVGSTIDSAPDSVQWRAVEATADQSFTLEQGWEHPLAVAAETPATAPDIAPAHHLVAHARLVKGQRPMPAQTVVSNVWLDEDEACATAQQHWATTGWWVDGGLEPIDIDGFDPEDPPLLIGALVENGETHVLVFDDGLDGVVAVVPSEQPELEDGQVMQVDPGPETWTVQTLARGVWTDADRSDAFFSVAQPCSAPR